MLPATATSDVKACPEPKNKVALNVRGRPLYPRFFA